MTQETAKRLAGLGRGPDTELVHMTPGEVKSLQQLAMASGGSLTINPATGLPEAGFLSSMLPMLIGAGVTAATGGAAAPWMVGLGVGGLQAARTGSLSKGLMAGFGAYGGAGLGSALTSAGGANLAAAGGVNPTNLAGPAVPSIEAINPSNVAASTGDKMFAGVQGLGSEAGRNAFMQNIGGGKGLAMAGLAAASPMMMETTTKQPEIKTDASMGQRYSYSPGAMQPTPTPDTPGYENQGQNFGKEQVYFNPQYTQISNDAARKLYGFAGGGPVEAMSNANAIGANTGYPQANIHTGAYATPWQQPISQNVVTGAQDAATDPYTGEPKFAEGGDVGGYTYDPATQTYIKAGGQGITSVKPEGFDYQQQTGGVDGKMSPSQQAFFDNETPADRDARMAQVSNILSMAIPGASIARGISDYANSVTNANAMSSMQAAQQADVAAAAGEGIGGSDISGQSEGTPALANGGLSALAQGGMSHLGDYSDGGRLLRGPGDGVSDDIPATIGHKQPARLADGEFVVPARIVSELGNGSTEAGARKLYAMMERVQKARGKTVGKGKIAVNSKASKHLPA